MIVSGYCSDSLKQIIKVLIFLRIQKQWNTVPLQSNLAVFTKSFVAFFHIVLLRCCWCSFFYEVNHVRYTARP